MGLSPNVDTLLFFSFFFGYISTYSVIMLFLVMLYSVLKINFLYYDYIYVCICWW